MNDSVQDRPGMVGAVLLAVGVATGLVLWLVLEQFGIDPFQRMMLAVCSPPALLSVLLGVYMLVGSGSTRDDL